MTKRKVAPVKRWPLTLAVIFALAGWALSGKLFLDNLALYVVAKDATEIADETQQIADVVKQATKQCAEEGSDTAAIMIIARRGGVERAKGICPNDLPDGVLESGE